MPIYALADFFDLLRIDEGFTLYPPEPVQESRTAGGDVLRASMGAALWQGRLPIAPCANRDAEALQALIFAAARTGASVMLTHPRHRAPRADPTGAGLGGASPVIASGTGGDQLRMSGLPASYTLSAGDYLSFTYGSSPTRHAFHRLASGGEASLAGLSPLLRVDPPIRPGFAVGAAVKLVNPAFKAVLRSPSPGGLGFVATAGATFEFVQTLR